MNTASKGVEYKLGFLHFFGHLTVAGHFPSTRTASSGHGHGGIVMAPAGNGGEGRGGGGVVECGNWLPL